VLEDVSIFNVSSFRPLVKCASILELITMVANGSLAMTMEDLISSFTFIEMEHFVECNLLTSRISYPDYVYN
jgi:hypothetical protein